MGERWARGLGWCLIILGLHGLATGEAIAGFTLAGLGAIMVFHSWGTVHLSEGHMTWHEYALPVVAHVRIKARSEEAAEAVLREAMEGDTLPRGLHIMSVDIEPEEK